MAGREQSDPFRLKVWGENACFTRPEMKVERVSYDVMTPSAARGILEAILWKPAIRWRVTRIDVLKPIRWESVRRNEVGCRMTPSSNGFCVDEMKPDGGLKYRQQRAGLFLRDVAYTIHALIELTDRAGADEKMGKFVDMFLRRVESGQCFHRPCLGTREFAAEFALVPRGAPDPAPIDESRDLGWMLLDVIHDAIDDANHVHTCNERCAPRFFNATLDRGRLVEKGRDGIPLLEGEGVRG